MHGNQLQLPYQGTPVDAAEEVLLQPAHETLSERWFRKGL